MSEIKIYVSQRIDLRAVLIDNPLFIPVRCGAVYDAENPRGLTGDDSGDNISHKRMSFSELTVQYWAWKNTRSDYVGLCHYRRYLSFADRDYAADRYNMVHVPCLLPEEERRFGLLDREKMEKCILPWDALTSRSADVGRIPLPQGRQANTVREWWEAQADHYLPSGCLEVLLETLERLSPETLPAADRYLAGDRFRGSNCFVMKWELFDRLCRFEFPILFAAEREIEARDPSLRDKRIAGYLGEILYGVFFTLLEEEGKASVQERQLVYFRDASEPLGTGDLWKKRAISRTDKLLRPLGEVLLPIGGGKREALKSRINQIKSLGGKKA